MRLLLWQPKEALFTSLKALVLMRFPEPVKRLPTFCATHPMGLPKRLLFCVEGAAKVPPVFAVSRQVPIVDMDPRLSACTWQWSTLHRTIDAMVGEDSSLSAAGPCETGEN